MRALQGLGAAVVVAAALSLWLVVGMGASYVFAVVAGAVLGLVILAVVGTRSGPRDVQADAAWRAAAPDLPPASDRRAMESSQTQIPGPEKARPGRRPKAQAAKPLDRGAAR
jgi:hypothetical protein